MDSIRPRLALDVVRYAKMAAKQNGRSLTSEVNFVLRREYTQTIPVTGGTDKTFMRVVRERYSDFEANYKRRKAK